MTDTTNLTGAYPLDPTTDVGLLRLEIGDLVGVVHDPADGQAEYQYLGDSTLRALLDKYPSNPSIALARGLGAMATQMIAAATDIQVDDIRIKTVEKAQLMLTRATNLELGAITWDAATAFQIVPTTNDPGGWRPQGTPAENFGYWGAEGGRIAGPSGF